MGANFKQIDRHFKRQLGNYSQSAPDEIWGNIEQVLNNKQQAKKIAFYRIAAAVAAFAIIGSGFLYLSRNTESIDNNQLITENNTQQKSGNNTEIINQEKKELVTRKEKENQRIETTNYIARKESVEEIKTSSDNKVVVEKNIERRSEKLEKLTQKQVLLSEGNRDYAIVDVREQNIKSYLKNLPVFYASYNLNDLIETKEVEDNRWAFGGEFTPLYSYRHITETRSNTYDNDFYNSSENPMMSYTGGLNLQYKTSGRFTIQAGVYYTTMGQSLDYMSVYANSAYDLVDQEYRDRFISSYSIANSSGSVSFNSQYVIVDEKAGRVNNLSNNKAQFDVSDPAFNNLDAEIQQNFQYVEVPVLLRYKVIDKNLDVNIVGGIGANFLVGNDVILKYGSNKEIIGETNGVNTINYNGTFGFGIEYPLMDKINIRLEPSIKYYLNEINSNSYVESHPYSIGIYTGINYTF